MRKFFTQIPKAVELLKANSTVPDEDIVLKLFWLKCVQNIFIQKVKLHQIHQIQEQVILKLLYLNQMEQKNQFTLKRMDKVTLLLIMLLKSCKELLSLLNEIKCDLNIIVDINRLNE